MDILSLIASVAAFAIAFLLFRKKQKENSDYILTAWVFIFALQFLCHFLLEQEILVHELHALLNVFMLSHAPFVFVYTTAITSAEFKLNFKSLYHFGFIFIFIASLIPHLLLDHHMLSEEMREEASTSQYELLPLISQLLIQVYFLIRTVIVVLNHQNTIKESFSFEEKINLAWMKRIVIAFFIILIVNFLGLAIVSARFVSHEILEYAMIMWHVAIFFYLTYSSYHQRNIYRAIQEVNPAPIEKEIAQPTAPKEHDENDPVIQKLRQLMDNEKLYLQAELNIGNVANELEMHSHHLSKMINTKLEMNFYEFVNEYRVNEFKNLAANPRNKHISILGLAMDAGFNSKATFNRIFKKSTGLTPSEFRENYRF